LMAYDASHRATPAEPILEGRCKYHH
jgi:hypothetical protein